MKKSNNSKTIQRFYVTNRRASRLSLFPRQSDDMNARRIARAAVAEVIG